MPKRFWIYAGVSAIWLLQNINRPGGSVISNLVTWAIVTTIALVLIEGLYRFFSKKTQKREESQKNSTQTETKFSKLRKSLFEKTRNANWFKFSLALATLLIAAAIVYGQVIQPMINRRNYWKCIKLNANNGERALDFCLDSYPQK